MIKKILVTVLISIPLAAFCQNAEQLSIDRIYKNNEFRGEFVGQLRWVDGGEGYTKLERAAGGNEIVRYETGSGARSVLVSASDLTPKDSENALAVADYQWSDDKTKLLIFTNTARVWRRNTRGDYWVLSVSSKELQQLAPGAKASTLMFAKFSPNGQHVAYVKEHNIYVEEISTGAVATLTADGNNDIINGTFDWVHEEEFGLRDGFRWSPDGTSIAFWRLDASSIRDFYMINNTDSVYSQIIPIQYPKVGEDNSSSKIGVANIASGKTKWMKLLGDPKESYLARMEWANDSEELMVQYLNRLQNTNSVHFCNAKTGDVRIAYTDKDDAWVSVNDNIVWFKGGKQFTWMSEKDGWRNLYLIDRATGTEKRITPGTFDAISVNSIDEKAGWLYYMASPNNATQRYLYRSKVNGKGNPVRISPSNMAGVHNYNIAPNQMYAIHNYSNANSPGVTSIVSLPDHKVVRQLATNNELKQKVEALTISPMEFFQLDIGIAELDAYMIKPPDFDQNKKYPVLFYVYGEPAAQTVMDGWGGSTYLWHQMLAQQGYVIISMDNRGTPAPKGREWRKSIYRKIGINNPADQAAGTLKALELFDFLDANRVGVWGWSGGGSMTLNCMFQYPEIYKTGMSVAPVGNQLFYDNIYQERYMGLPWTNEEGFIKGSPVNHAQNLKGNLLLVHGTGDDNVHYQNSETVINAMIKHNKYFTMMAYPNRSHGIREGENTSRHLRILLTRYLNENMAPGGVSKTDLGNLKR